MPHYSFLDRVLHRAALQVVPLAEMAFDMDQRAVPRPASEVADGRHVFVSGLARAGTTILMRRLYAAGAFCSLTYRDMPFVLAPNLWRRLSRISNREAVANERAHGDRILVDFDSPESLDEVFWRIFDKESYITRTHLSPHMPGAELRQSFISYVNAIIHSYGGQPSRYLSKNNNNILRLNSLRRTFPNALILVPFRHPATHAASLLRQHRTFVEMQTSDRFVQSYMTWLGHHEFGLDHRPFRFAPEDTAAVPPGDHTQIGYWLERWIEAYQWLEQSAPDSAVFVGYEDLCGNPGVWTSIAQMAGLDAASGSGEAFRQSSAATDGIADARQERRALDIYSRLVERSRETLGLSS